MKKNPSTWTFQGSAASRAAMALLCAVLVTQPSWAADPVTDEAVLNFVGADIESVIKAIGHYTNTTFIIDPRVKGTINLVSEKQVSKAQAFRLLTSALRLQGFSVVAGDGFTKVVPEADAKLQAGPTQTAPAQADRLKGDQIATRIFRLNYESSTNMVTVLRPLISPNNTINANPGNNTLIITDYADNLTRLGKIIAALDAPSVGDMDVVPIRHAIATDIAVMVNRLLESGTAAMGAPDTGRTSLLADARTNSVIVRAPSGARASLAKSLIAKLDQPTALPGNVHVVYLKNADATKLAQTLRAVVASDASAQASSPSAASATSSASLLSSGSNSMSGGAPSSAPQSSAAPASLPTGGAAGFIQADPSTNTLIITASETVYRNLRVVIDQLDARRAQVYIESLIVEVTSEKAAEFGVQWASLSGDSGSSYRIGSVTGFSSGGNNLISQAAARVAGNQLTAPGNGLNLGIFQQSGGQIGLGALARALATEDGTNILSTPNIITLDNEEAKIIVGQNVPFITGQFTTAASGGSAGVNPFQTIERKDVGLSLRVRPQISEGGTVKMSIYQETSDIQPTSGASDIITNKRSIETNVLVDDGQIIVLGGLIKDTTTDNVEKVPGLGDIPVIGNLFKYQKRGRSKTNLMVFLRPTVLRSNEQSVNLVDDRYNFIRKIELDAQPAPMALLPNMGSSILPPLQDGRMLGGPTYNFPQGKTQPIAPASPVLPPPNN